MNILPTIGSLWSVTPSRPDFGPILAVWFSGKGSSVTSRVRFLVAKTSKSRLPPSVLLISCFDLSFYLSGLTCLDGKGGRSTRGKSFLYRSFFITLYLFWRYRHSYNFECWTGPACSLSECLASWCPLNRLFNLKSHPSCFGWSSRAVDYFRATFTNMSLSTAPMMARTA